MPQLSRDTGIAKELARLAPRLPGCEFSAAEEITKYLEISAPLRFGLETAFMDIRAQVRGCPLTNLLGGRPVGLAVNAIISAKSPGQAASEAREAVKMGFTSLKLKVGLGNLDEDEALVSAARGETGPLVKLRIDPNQAWDVPTAIEALNRLSRYGIEYVEQPVPALRHCRSG